LQSQGRTEKPTPKSPKGYETGNDDSTDNQKGLKEPKHLTKRCSQPLVGALSHFKFMKQLSILAKLAFASGG